MRSQRPKNIYLGSEKKIVKHLNEYYKNDSAKLKKLKKDWLEVLGEDCKWTDVYDRLFMMLFELGRDKFMDKTMNLDVLYPISD